MPVMKTLTINGRTFIVTPVVPTDSVTLLASAWKAGDGKYHQVVELSRVTPHTKVDLQPTNEQLVEFHDKVLGFVAENDGGVVTVFAIGDKPTNDHTIQVTMTEVEATGKIRGNTVGTTMPRSDWLQTDPTKADYIKNKPTGLGGTGDGSGQNPGLSDEDMAQIVAGVKDELLKTKIVTSNIYDETTAVDDSSENKRGAVMLPTNAEEYTVCISTAGKYRDYIYQNQIVVYTDNGDIVSGITFTKDNNSNGTRSGVCVKIPAGANAVRMEFVYRVRYSGGVLCHDMMVTLGDEAPEAYEAYATEVVLDGADCLTPKQGDTRYPQKNLYYVSTSGSDYNDGLTKETALASIEAAVQLGAKKIAVEAGEYFITTAIRLSGLNDIHIFAYRDGEEYAHTAPQRAKAKFTGATYYSGYSINDDGVYRQDNVAEGYDFYLVFNLHSKNPTINERTFHANVMVIHDDPSNDYYLRPVLSYAECVSTAETFYWDGSTLFFNATSDDFTKIAVIASEGGLRILDCCNVVMDDICIGMTKLEAVIVEDSTGVVLNNCEANASAATMGFAFTHANGVLNNCYATKNAYDGFNFHGYGTTVMNDCHAENNYDDGCSHHDGCIGTINGGRFSGSGKAGIAPAYGAKVNIYNAVCDSNNIGIGYLTAANGHAPMTGIVSSCAMLNNKHGLQVDSLCSVIAIDCKYSGNETDKAIKGTITEC